MRTLVEFYDPRPVCNLLAPVSYKPRRVVYLCGHPFPDEARREALKKFILGRSPGTSVYFSSCDTASPREVTSALRGIEAVCGPVTVELTGGGEVAAYAAGICASGSRAIWYDFAHDRFSPGEDEAGPVKLTVDELFETGGGEVLGYGRIPRHCFTDELCSRILAVWNVFVRFCDVWPDFSAWMQTSAAAWDRSSPLSLSAPYRFRDRTGMLRQSNRGALTALEKAGAISGLRLDGENSERHPISFEFTSSAMRTFLLDAGVWLELYCYVTARRSGYFDDAAQSVVVGWKNGSAKAGDGVIAEEATRNELDCVATRGVRSLFISCKLSLPQTHALNEIRTLTDRFGGVCGRPVLVTMGKLDGAPYAAQRARQLGITIIGRSDLVSGRLGEILKAAINSPAD